MQLVRKLPNQHWEKFEFKANRERMQEKRNLSRLLNRIQIFSLRISISLINRIEVQLDGNEYGLDQHGAIFPISVFPTTTVRELRATVHDHFHFFITHVLFSSFQFEISQGFAPTNQYFFVNGHLAHDNSTMKDLNVGPGSLFVLYFLKHSKNNVNIFLRFISINEIVFRHSVLGNAEAVGQIIRQPIFVVFNVKHCPQISSLNVILFYKLNDLRYSCTCLFCLSNFFILDIYFYVLINKIWPLHQLEM